MSEATLDLAVIGNGRTAALVEPSGRIVWWCLPRYDGDPVKLARTTCATPPSW